MNSTEWNERGWTKTVNPSGEVVRTKKYTRRLISYVNTMPENIKTRRQLAELLQIPVNDLMGELTITVDIVKHKHITRRYNLKRYKRYMENKQ